MQSDKLTLKETTYYTLKLLILSSLKHNKILEINHWND